MAAGRGRGGRAGARRDGRRAGGLRWRPAPGGRASAHRSALRRARHDVTARHAHLTYHAAFVAAARPQPGRRRDGHGRTPAGNAPAGDGTLPARPRPTRVAPPAAPHTTSAAAPRPAPSAARTTTPAPAWKSCAYYSGTTLTVYGQQNSRVKEVQCVLKARGYNIGPSGVDGIFGADTLTEVKKFQGKHHLKVDGEVGANTWAALRS